MDKAEELRKRLASMPIGEGKPLPHVVEFTEWDEALLEDLHGVLDKHGITGRIKEIIVDCGFPRPKPPIRRCFRICWFGPDDKPICIWICM